MPVLGLYPGRPPGNYPTDGSLTLATLQVQSVGKTGLKPIYVSAAAGGDKITTGAGVMLHAKNTGGAERTITLITPGTVDGLAIADRQVAVPAGEDRLIPIRDAYRGPDGLCSITYDAVTSLTVAAIRAPVSG